MLGRETEVEIYADPWASGYLDKIQGLEKTSQGLEKIGLQTD